MKQLCNAAVPLIEKIHYRHHIHCRTVAVKRIHIVAQSDKADIERRKNIVNVLPDLDVITEYGKSFFLSFQTCPTVSA
ncbi:MAG: hypothetical protein NC320_06005 [Clostridium sp.]|nr:hypothetical protein [Clostridium sp.]